MEDFRLEVNEVTDFGDWLLTTGRRIGHGTSSGVLVTQPHVQILALRRGLVVRIEDFASRGKALEAVGLGE